MGAGVAGLQAIATARRLGAVVEANDIRPAVKEQVESLGAKFIDTGTPPQAETTGGYAKETSAEYARKQREILTEHLSAADVVITTALIPGRKAPILVSDDMIKAMSPGSVIVDLAVEMGGNVEGAKSGETVEKHGVKIIGEPNLAAMVGADASRMFARNVAAVSRTDRQGRQARAAVGRRVRQGHGRHPRRRSSPSTDRGRDVGKGSLLMDTLFLIVFVFVLAAIVGFEMITKVPPTLHTPLMSGSNAISGVTIVGALLSVNSGAPWLATTFGFLAVVAATINVVGGFLVTDRMLSMFGTKKKKS